MRHRTAASGVLVPRSTSSSAPSRPAAATSAATRPERTGGVEYRLCQDPLRRRLNARCVRETGGYRDAVEPSPNDPTAGLVDWPRAAAIAGRLATPGPSAERGELEGLVD